MAHKNLEFVEKKLAKIFLMYVVKKTRSVRPFFVRHVAGIAQMIAILFRAVLGRPRRRSSTNQVASYESRVIERTGYAGGDVKLLG